MYLIAGFVLACPVRAMAAVGAGCFPQKGVLMDQSFYTSEELERKLAEMKIHERREILLCVDEILAFLNTEGPAEKHWKAGQKFIQAGRKHRLRRPETRV